MIDIICYVILIISFIVPWGCIWNKDFLNDKYGVIINWTAFILCNVNYLADFYFNPLTFFSSGAFTSIATIGMFFPKRMHKINTRNHKIHIFWYDEKFVFRVYVPTVLFWPILLIPFILYVKKLSKIEEAKLVMDEIHGI